MIMEDDNANSPGGRNEHSLLFQDKDDRFTHANSNTIDFSDYPITDGNHYVFRNIEKIWLQERTPEVKSDQCLLAHGFR
jgi:hypothetical protein